MLLFVHAHTWWPPDCCTFFGTFFETRCTCVPLSTPDWRTYRYYTLTGRCLRGSAWTCVTAGLSSLSWTTPTAIMTSCDVWAHECGSTRRSWRFVWLPIWEISNFLWILLSSTLKTMQRLRDMFRCDDSHASNDRMISTELPHYDWH